MESSAYAFDIYGGWLLICHVAYVSFGLVVSYTIRRQRQYLVFLARFVLSCSYVALVTVLRIYYDEIYKMQHVLYASAIAVVIPCFFVLRFVVSCPMWRLNKALLPVAFESVVLSLSLVSALFVQGQLVGRILEYGKPDKTYDFYHGNWHILLAYASAIAYTRLSNVVPIVLGLRRTCDQTMSSLDYAGIALMGVYAVALLMCKEWNVTLNTSIGVGACINVLLTLHAVATYFVVSLNPSTSTAPQTLHASFRASASANFTNSS